MHSTAEIANTYHGLASKKLYHSLAVEASNKNVFGSPSYVLNEEVFWGQDRLDLLEEAVVKNK